MKPKHQVHESERKQWHEDEKEWIRLAQIYQCILEDTQRGHAYRRIGGRWRVPYAEDGWTARSLASDWGHETRVTKQQAQEAPQESVEE